ncbi:hypothetical protein H4R34_000961 [Dimargaris verticillata]|uniref:AAA+ ATPase domain-containing protein n=1 Tax=Dimargaris verticillata TaxID=2761393 RepID=A0A9W8B5A8_9FUNG|nr:hypothetical protein H4R34_000961 [Dimargaris verticillata]
MCNSAALTASKTQQLVGGYDAIVLELATILQNLSAQQATACNSEATAVPERTSVPSGILVQGASGTGKTHLVQTVVEKSRVPFRYLDAPAIFQTNAGDSEQFLSTVFAPLRSRGPSVLILDNFDALCPRTLQPSELVRRVFSRLLALIDEQHTSASKLRVLVIGLTNIPTGLPLSITRSGRLEKVYTLQLTRAQQRLKVLCILTDHSTAKQAILLKIASLTHGFTPADLQNLAMNVTKSLITRVHTANQSTAERQMDYDHNISLADFEASLRVVKPSGLAEFNNKIPAVDFNDIYGLDTIIEQLKNALIRPFEHPKVYQQLGIQPPAGLLLHGPPGVGKTMMCSAIATASRLNCILIEGSQIRSKYVGESEKMIAQLFAQARQNAPCLLVIDQLDILAPRRGTSQTSENTSERIVTSFLTEMDGFNTDHNVTQRNVLLIATSNRPHAIDPALLRPGRFDEHLHIPLPSHQQRLSITQGLMKRMPLALDEQYVESLVARTANCSSADLVNLFQEAALISLRVDITHTKITQEHVEQALALQVNPIKLV